jgi:hypothetical protein
LLIKLREFVDDGRRYGYNLEQFLGQLWRLSNADIELVLNQRKALVLLDGLELLLVQCDKSREVERDEVYRDLSVERKLELLSYVAVKKFEQEQYVLFEQEELEGYIGKFLGIEGRESQGVLRALAYAERCRRLAYRRYRVCAWVIDGLFLSIQSPCSLFLWVSTP